MSDQQQQKPGIQPTLADLDKPAAQQQQPIATTEPVKTPENEPVKNPTTTPSPDPNKPEPIKVDPNKATDPPVEIGEEGTDNDEPADPTAFWGEVGKLRGDGLAWDFPQDIDPMTPAGIHHAIKRATDRELEIFEENIMKQDARSYAYMLHRANGGSDEDFFAQKTEVLPEIDTLKNSVDLQQAFYKRSLTRKGILPDQADLIVKDAIEKNKLGGLVEAEYKQQADQQETQLKELLRVNTENQAREDQIIRKMGTVLQERIIENKGLGITIPDTKRPGFLQFVNNMVTLDRQTGKFYINQELSSDNLSEVLESLYYMHVKGNMDDIITNRANQQNTQKIRMRMQSDKTKKSTQTDPNKQTTGKEGIQRPMSEL